VGSEMCIRDRFIDNIFNYPTYSEALRIAALNASDRIETEAARGMA
jgi:hypothetical protein